MTQTTKSWSTLEIKSVDEARRIIRGIASTPSTDRAGDIVEPRGAKFTLPIPLLSQHDHGAPIGMVTMATVTDSGIEIEAEIAKDSSLDYVEKSWNQIKAGLVRGLSIGFRALKSEPIKGGGYRFKQWLFLELSAVTIPCNADASITSIKKFDFLSTQFGNQYSESFDQVKSDKVETPKLDQVKLIIQSWSQK
jgi:HK97 family phage prohead protease